MANVQISGDEQTAVWKNLSTGKIVCFAPLNARFPMLQGCIALPLTHAHEIDYWANEYRKQQKEEFEWKQYEKLERDTEIRKRIRAALKARRDVVGPLQRADIDRGLAFLDRIEARQVKTQEGALLIEQYESNVRQEDIALDSPAYKVAQ
jgi:hypothetical protein